MRGEIRDVWRVGVEEYGVVVVVGRVSIRVWRMRLVWRSQFL